MQQHIIAATALIISLSISNLGFAYMSLGTQGGLVTGNQTQNSAQIDKSSGKLYLQEPSTTTPHKAATENTEATNPKPSKTADVTASQDIN